MTQITLRGDVKSLYSWQKTQPNVVEVCGEMFGWVKCRVPHDATG